MDTILVVDDSPVVRRVLSLTLESSGYVVLTAEDGAAALSIIEDEPIDLIFCDIHMPKMNGIEFLKTVRANCGKDELPIIMLTASGEQDAHAEATLQGANSLLTKPASSQVVLATAHSYLHGESTLVE